MADFILHTYPLSLSVEKHSKLEYSHLHPWFSVLHEKKLLKVVD